MMNQLPNHRPPCELTMCPFRACWSVQLRRSHWKRWGLPELSWLWGWWFRVNKPWSNGWSNQVAPEHRTTSIHDGYCRLLACLLAFWSFLTHVTTLDSWVRLSFDMSCHHISVVSSTFGIPCCHSWGWAWSWEQCSNRGWHRHPGWRCLDFWLRENGGVFFAPNCLDIWFILIYDSVLFFWNLVKMYGHDSWMDNWSSWWISM